MSRRVKESHTTTARGRQVTRCLGRLDPASKYTSYGAMRFAGIGSSMLDEGRRLGILHPIQLGWRIYYRGAELDQLIERLGKPA